MRNKLKPTEHEIQNSIIEYLKLKKWFVYRINSGMIPMHGAWGKPRMVRLGVAGMPDLMAFRHGNIGRGYVDLFFIEVKRPGFEATEVQREKMNELSKYGATCITAHSLEEIQEKGF